MRTENTKETIVIDYIMVNLQYDKSGVNLLAASISNVLLNAEILYNGWCAYMEQFSIPGAGGIIIKEMQGEKNILIQTRIKPHAPHEDGLIEIPAGKIRVFESIFDTLKREIKEETGLDVVEILGENLSTVYEENSYKVINFMPFSCSQNLIGDYPIMVFVFICKVEGELLPFSDESKNYKWIPMSEIKRIVTDTPQILYPMHVDTLKKYVNFCE